MIIKKQPTRDITFGVTLKDSSRPEQNNMALHSCENKTDVIENREALAQQLGVTLNQFVLATQTHSPHFHEVTGDDKGKGAYSTENAIPDTDALFTYEQDIVLGTFTADCVPMLFWSTSTSLIGSVHSGWQGTVKEIVPKLLTHLKEVKGEDMSTLHVYVGPALSQVKFEVDQDVADRYKKLGYAEAFIYFNSATAKFHIDNALTVKEQCLLGGISPEHIHLSDICTFQSDEGFSYRQHKKDGRHLGFIIRHTDTPHS